MVCGRTRCRDDEAAVDEPLQGFMDLVGWKILFQLADELRNALTGSYRGGQRTIERAVQKEFPVLGIEAHDVGRQHIDGEIRREPRNCFAVVLRSAVPPIVRPEASTRASALTATSLDRHCKTRILNLRGRSTRPSSAGSSAETPRVMCLRPAHPRGQRGVDNA